MIKDNDKVQKAKTPPAKTPAVKPVPINVPPLFRKIDWFVLAITFGAVWLVYLLTLAPELTLEDCGELCTGSFYAGIPHPPGYPFWSIYSWLWTALVPFGNVAWRVELGESFAAAMACGLIGFMVSRGSSMLIEGIDELKTMDRKWENAICIVTGTVAGLMMGFDGFLWKESVVINRISPFDVPWLMVVALCLLRWIYAPHQRRYLYIGMFFFGLCATIHQTMLVAAMGIEVCIALGHRRYGRHFFLGNTIIFFMVIFLMDSKTIPAFTDLSPMFIDIFYVVGLGSLAAYIWLAILTKETVFEFLRDGCAAAAFALLAAVPSQGSICALLSLVAFGCFLKLAWDTRELDLGWLVVVVCGSLWVCGAAFYFYEPIAGMTDPPMQWGYPRTVEGFFHALSRGQYEKANPTDIIHDPMRFVMQLGLLFGGLAESFSWVSLFIALLPLIFIFKMKNRERAWIIGLASIYLCIGILLTIIMNTSPERQSADENKAFFTASHAVVAIMIGYGLALMAAYMATHYQNFRRWGLLGGGVAALLAVGYLWNATGELFFGPAGQIGLSELPHWINQAFAKDQYGLPVFANLILLAIPLIFIGALLAYRERGPVLILLCLLVGMPVWSGLSHWYKSEQRNHWFGYWFGHDMFTPPYNIYPEIEKNTIIFGGTDPGRFCPTYMIFCESFIPHRCQPYLDQNFDRRDVYLITQNALADGTYLEYLRAQYNRSTQIDPPFFREFLKYVLGIPFGPDSPIVNTISEASYYMLDVPFTKLGAKIEARRRAEGVYPPKEIYIPSPDDSQRCFGDYIQDAQRRMQEGKLKSGEDVHEENGKVSVSGQTAVMGINGLLTKVIFDHNPTNAFYVEESFPLDWMYPYETPSGIIMKINRNPLPSLSDDVLHRDHEFWSKYSERLVGNWITYDTSVKEIADFAQKVYLGNNYAGFTGDRKFIRDDDAQKAFSKLRSSIAGMYAWRLSRECPPEFAPKNSAELQSLEKETDFAFKQSFAFCPYSPEAVFRYVNFLLEFNRLDDALILAQTCLKMDPNNGGTADLVQRLNEFKKNEGQVDKARASLQSMEDDVREHPTNYQAAFNLASAYVQMQQPERAAQILDRVLADPKVPVAAVLAVAQAYAQMNNWPKLENTLETLVKVAPDEPEAWYDLAALKCNIGKNDESLKCLAHAIQLSNARLAKDPTQRNLVTEASKDSRFNPLRNSPDFQKLVAQ